MNGQPVLALNNYDLETGERSVFDQELNRTDKDPDAPPPAEASGSGWVAAPPKAEKKATVSRVPKTLDSSEVSRMEWNENIR